MGLSLLIPVISSHLLNFVSPVEKCLVENVLQGTSEESDEEDLLERFTRMGSHKLPAKVNMQQTITTMAHKTILQESKYVIDSFSTQMVHVKPLLPDKERLCTKQKSHQVRRCLSCSKQNFLRQNRLHLQRCVKNAEQTKAKKILRFCTGSSFIAVDKITVSFNRESGPNRRPVSHTCGAFLELPCTYCSHPDFPAEFDHVLASNYLEMEIM